MSKRKRTKEDDETRPKKSDNLTPVRVGVSRIMVTITEAEAMHVLTCLNSAIARKKGNLTFMYPILGDIPETVDLAASPEVVDALPRTLYHPNQEKNPFIHDYTIALEKWIALVLSSASDDVMIHFLQHIQPKDIENTVLLLQAILLTEQFQREHCIMVQLLGGRGTMFYQHWQAYLFRLLLSMMMHRLVFDDLLQVPHLTRSLEALPRLFTQYDPAQDVFVPHTTTLHPLWRFTVVMHPGWRTSDQSRPPGLLLHACYAAIIRLANADTVGPWLSSSMYLHEFSLFQQAKYMAVPVGNDFGVHDVHEGLNIHPSLLLLPPSSHQALQEFLNHHKYEDLMAHYPLPEPARVVVDQKLQSLSGLAAVFAWREVITLGEQQVSQPHKRQGLEPLYSSCVEPWKNSTAIGRLRAKFMNVVRKQCLRLEGLARGNPHHRIENLGSLRIGNHSALYTYEQRFDQGMWDVTFGIGERFTELVLQDLVQFNQIQNTVTFNTMHFLQKLRPHLVMQLTTACQTACWEYSSKPWVAVPLLASEVLIERQRLAKPRLWGMHKERTTRETKAMQLQERQDRKKLNPAQRRQKIAHKIEQQTEEVEEVEVEKVEEDEKETVMGRPLQWHLREVLERLKLYIREIPRGVANYYNPCEYLVDGVTRTQINGWRTKVMTE